MTEFVRRDPVEDVETDPASVRVRKGSVRNVDGGIEITMPSNIDDAILHFVSKPALERSKSKAKAIPTEPSR